MGPDLIALGTVPAGEGRPPEAKSTTSGGRFGSARVMRSASSPRAPSSGSDAPDPTSILISKLSSSFDDANQAARAYAHRCDREAPTRGDRTAGAAVAAPLSCKGRLVDR